MKCVVLAGGAGERLWPLSRKNCPKQFIEIENNHSIFQDTIARNIPYCDEFIIVTNADYKYLVENQMEPFQGINYRCIYEEKGKKTTAAIMMACLSLEPTEYVLVTNASMLISSPEYKDAIIAAKQNAYEGFISILVSKEDKTDNRYGYVIKKNEDLGNLVEKYIEKPEEEIKGEVYKNLGFLIFQNGVLMNTLNFRLLNECLQAYKTREVKNGNTSYRDLDVTPIAIERSVIEKAQNVRAVEISFPYRDIRTLDDLRDYPNKGTIINTSSSQIINTCKDKAIVVNGVDDLVVVNTEDALYIGTNGTGLKELLKAPELREFGEKSTLYNRSWGRYEDLLVEKDYRFRRVILNPGKTIYEHVHQKRMESWTILKGVGRFTIDGEAKDYSAGDTVTARIGMRHQISNIGEIPLALAEMDIGEVGHADMSSTTDAQTTEMQLGLSIDPMIKLTPALKDYLWGGNRLKERYGIQSDLDVVAEAWELSAHPDGESVVATGKHKGLTFSKYIETVGKTVLGWKCSPLQSFPMLVKFIDAKGNLSIQVHPNDDYALEHENQYGKNEMWYVIDAKPDSGLYVGFNKDVDKEEVKRRVQDNTITEILNFYPTKPGDVFFIPAGTVHAICEGNLICEIQQSSNCTYRLYDYDRRDKFGNPRQLHLEKALDVLNYEKYEATTGNVSCKYFENEIIDVIDGKEKNIRLNDERFLSLIVIDGEGELSIDNYRLDVKAGDSVFIPAQNDILKINGKMKLAISHI